MYLSCIWLNKCSVSQIFYKFLGYVHFVSFFDFAEKYNSKCLRPKCVYILKHIYFI